MEHRDDHQSEAAALTAIAGKLGCSPDSLRTLVRQTQRDGGERPGPTNAEIARITELGRENRELRQANEILRKASAYFAQAELDRPFRKLLLSFVTPKHPAASATLRTVPAVRVAR